MRQLSFFFTAVIFSGLAIMTSCSKNSSTPEVDQTPSISFTTGTGYVSSDATLAVNSTFKTGITAISNTNSGAKLTKFTIKRVFNNVPVSQDTTFSTSLSTINLDILAKTSTVVGQEKWYFKITDAKNQTKEIGFTITTIVTDKSTGISNIQELTRPIALISQR
jgi:hypothetical protein